MNVCVGITDAVSMLLRNLGLWDNIYEYVPLLVWLFSSFLAGNLPVLCSDELSQFLFVVKYFWGC
jgi:hypothetical protein